jgi:cholesterol transport system auxiliary component
MKLPVVRNRAFMRRSRWSAVSLAVLLTGCAGSVLESNVDPAQVYRLRTPGADDAPAPTSTAAGARPGALAVVVARPRAAAALDTDRVAVLPGGPRFDYYTGVRWAEPAPQMLQQALVDALARDGGFAAVLAAPARVPAELLLDVELRRFEAVAGSAGGPTVHVQLQASLVDTRRSVRIASFPCTASATAPENRMDAVIDAFARASTIAVEEVARRVGEAAAAIPAVAP